jgi:DNA helicase-2/ATP-dependent DNA helicase PcrA
MAINPQDEEALKRIINYPARGIGSTTIDKIIVLGNDWGKDLMVNHQRPAHCEFPIQCRNRRQTSWVR